MDGQADHGEPGEKNELYSSPTNIDPLHSASKGPSSLLPPATPIYVDRENPDQRLASILLGLSWGLMDRGLGRGE